MTQTLYGDDYQWGANGYDRHSNAELLKLERNGPVNYQDANGEQQLFSHMVVGVFCMAATAPLEGLGLADDLVRGASWLGRTSQTARTGAGIIKASCEFGKRVAKNSVKAVKKAAKRPLRAAKAALAVADDAAKRALGFGGTGFSLNPMEWYRNRQIMNRAGDAGIHVDRSLGGQSAGLLGNGQATVSVSPFASSTVAMEEYLHARYLQMIGSNRAVELLNDPVSVLSHEVRLKNLMINAGRHGTLGSGALPVDIDFLTKAFVDNRTWPEIC